MNPPWKLGSSLTFPAPVLLPPPAASPHIVGSSRRRKTASQQVKTLKLDLALIKLYKSKCRGTDARLLIPTTLILQSKTIANLITAIANYAIAITESTGKAVAAGGTGLKELRRFAVGHDTATLHTQPSSTSSHHLPRYSLAIAMLILLLQPSKSSHPQSEWEAILTHRLNRAPPGTQMLQIRASSQ